MRSWPLGRSLSGAWIRLFFLALLPLILTAAIVAVYQARTIPTEVRESSLNWVETDQLLFDKVLLGHVEMAKRMADASESRPPEVVAEGFAKELKGRTLMYGMGWFPNQGEPVVSESFRPISGEIQAMIASNSERFQLWAVPSLGQSLLLITESRPTGRQVHAIRLDMIEVQLTGPDETERWFALEDGTGFELAMNDPSLRLTEMQEVVSVRVPSEVASGWSFVGYISTRSATQQATRQLWWAVGFALLSLLAGLGLVIPAARKLLMPIYRLRQIARSLPVMEPAAASQLPQPDSSVALVDHLEDRLLYLEEEHKHFFAGSDVPFCIVTFEGSLHEVNEAWCRLIGYPPEYFKDHRISSTLHPEERFHPDHWPELKQRSMTVSWVWHHLNASGEDLWISWSVTSDVEREFFYAVCRNVTPERAQERHRLLQSTLQELWLVTKSGVGIQAQLIAILDAVEPLFPQAAFAVWEETDNGRWLMRAGAAKVHPEMATLFFEITGELVRFGLLAVESAVTLTSEEESFLKNLAQLISTGVKQEQESIRLTVQHSVNQLLAEAEGISDLIERLLPLIGQPMSGIAARYWAPTGVGHPRVIAEWMEPESGIDPEVFTMHQWMVHQTLSDGHPRWIPEGTRLPHRPAETMPVGRITFAVRVGARVVGCIDCLVPVLRTPEAGFLTLLESLGAQIGLYLERRLAEEEREQQALLAAGRADVMELVASGGSLESVLERICLLAEALLPQIWTLAVFYDAEPDRPLILTSPSCPPDQMALFREILSVPGSHEIIRRNDQPTFIGSPDEITEALPIFGPPLVAMGVQSCWVWPVPIPPRNGTLRFGFYATVEGGIDRAEPLLVEVSHLAQMAVERWWLEKTLNRRADLLLAHMQEGLVAVDGEFAIVETNPAARKILRMPAGALSTDALPEPLADAFRRALLPDAQPFPATMKVEGAPVYAYVSQVRSEEGALLGAIAILEDSTNRQRFQQLQTSLVANVSHDLKAPLAALGALVETVAGQQLPAEEQKQYLSAIQDEIGRLRRLTNDLLLLARLDAGLLTLEPETLAMGDLLRGMAEAWAPRCQANGLTLTVVGEDLAVWADYDRLIQILTNLLDNAIKFTPDGGSIQLGVERDAEGRVRIFVRDTGAGIAPEHMERLGSRFYMVDPARQRTQATGTGLGLSIVRSLAEQMGGQIQFESVLGQGTTVWLELRGAESV